MLRPPRGGLSSHVNDSPASLETAGGDEERGTKAGNPLVGRCQAVDEGASAGAGARQARHASARAPEARAETRLAGAKINGEAAAGRRPLN